MNDQIHVFDNGVKVYDHCLLPHLRKRYKIQNVHEIEEEGIFADQINSIREGGCYVNIGSAIGYYPLLAKKLKPELAIYVVEPLRLHRQYFAENILLNGFHPADFVVYSEGIFSKKGRTTFVEHRFASQISETDYSLRSSQIKEAIKKALTRMGIGHYVVSTKKTIQTITLDHLLNRIGREVDLLQMDVQGAEAQILSSGSDTLRSGRIKKLLIGSHSPDIHRQCVEILLQSGYVIELEKDRATDLLDGIIVAAMGTQNPGRL